MTNVTNQTDQSSMNKHLAESERITQSLFQDPLYLQHMFGSHYDDAKNDLRALIGHPAILSAFKKVTRSSGKKLQRRVTDLLNVISYVHYKTHISPKSSGVKPCPRAVVFADKDRNLVKDDWNFVRIQPDFSASATDEETLRTVIRNRDDTPIPSFNTMIGAGEQQSEGKSIAVGKGQLSNYLKSTKMYQPQLTTVHGFHLTDTELTLWSHSPCGNCHSEVYPAKENEVGKRPKTAPKNVWEFTVLGRPQALVGYIFHVLLLYHSLRTSLPQIKHVTAGIWKVCDMFVVPFYSAAGPGRESWVGYEVERRNGKLVIVGIVKVYWPDINTNFDEREILKHIHVLGEIPGIVIQGESEVKIENVQISMEGFKVRRELKVIHMKSWGDHLSACKDVLELLKATYDGILAHWMLYKRNILHRDVSWGNVLCNPQYGRELVAASTAEDLLDNLWIEKVLGNPNGGPRALLTDFDHAAIIDVIRNEEYTPRLVRTGTPMFISVELSSKDAINHRGDYTQLTHLERRIISAEQHYGHFYQQVFPNATNNDVFLQRFKKIIEKEKHDAVAVEYIWSKTRPNSAHLLHHDVESFYWVLLWSVARAQPKGADTESERWTPYDSFCETMMAHTPGHENRRYEYLFKPVLITDILHSRLRNLSHLLANIACYLSVDWEKYREEIPVSSDHAHMAVLRLLLMEIIDIQGNRNLNVEFADQPRPFDTTGVIKGSRFSSTASSISSTGKRKAGADNTEDVTNIEDEAKRRKVTDIADADTLDTEDEEPKPKMNWHSSLKDWVAEKGGVDGPSELDDIGEGKNGVLEARGVMVTRAKHAMGANKQ